jgi:hypothetical protein
MSEGRLAPGSTDVSPYVPESPARPLPYRDLCSTCNHAETCGSRSTPERPILFCELFEASAPAPTAAPAAAPPAALAGGQGAVEHKGLCANCENRETCTMARPEGGVWHCEEYR